MPSIEFNKYLYKLKLLIMTAKDHVLNDYHTQFDPQDY